jgi:hypothetical protein
MKKKKEKHIREKLEIIRENVERKRLAEKNTLEKNKSEQDAKSRERLDKSLEAEERAKNKLLNHLARLEDERTEIELYIQEKSNQLYPYTS